MEMDVAAAWKDELMLGRMRREGKGWEGEAGRRGALYVLRKITSIECTELFSCTCY